ncbi:hypothetical protein Tco_0411068 [Tanacetum coccineum]
MSSACFLFFYRGSKTSLGVLAVLLMSVEVIQSNLSPCFTIHTISPLKWVSGCMIANLACQVHKWVVGSDRVTLFDVIKAEVVLQEDQHDFLADRLEEMDSDCSINGDITGPSSDSELISEITLVAGKQPYLLNRISVWAVSNCELERYKEKVNVLEERQTSKAFFIQREEHLDSQMRGIIVDRNQKVKASEKQVIVQRQQIDILSNMHSFLKDNYEKLKKESSVKQDKYIDEIVVLEKAKKKLEKIVYKVGQTTQSMHMLTKPQNFYDNTHKIALGYQNPLYLTQAQRIQPVLYNAKVSAEKHDPIFVYDSEDTLLTTKESRLKMKEKQEKNNDKTVDYSKLNKLSEYFIPQK